MSEYEKYDLAIKACLLGCVSVVSVYHLLAIAGTVFQLLKG